jgi:hypothetical protein
MDKQKVTTFAWGLVAGGIALSAVLFGTGWAVRADTAERDARVMANTAVAERLAQICVAQFQAVPDKDQKLAALKEIDTWRRGNYVVEQGWATMPGSDSGTGQVASESATLLVNLKT